VATQASPRRIRLSSTTIAGVAVGAAVIFGIALYIAVEGDLGDAFADVRAALGQLIHRFGVPGSLALLYIEESGIPLPVPGDVYVTFLGHVASSRTLHLFASWIAIITVVTAGASNLYLISRRWGGRMVTHPRAHWVHLDPAGIARAERWFKRWGVLAMIFGRHIPGCRVPLTVVAGTLQFPYRLFAPSVAVSTAIWSGVLLLLGDRFGRSIGHFLSTHAWAYAVGTGILVAVVAWFVISGLLRDRARGRLMVSSGTERQV
jgi:membrane protein DedA with SNARE-associated domain